VANLGSQFMRTLYLDCFSGISGDMAVAAIRDLGVEESTFRTAITDLGLPEDIHFHFSRGLRQGIAGWNFDVHAHDHSSDTPHAHGRSLGEIRDLIEKSNLSEFVKERSISIFERIAKAEGKIHAVPAEDVTFHEVGAVDSIADIVLACAGLEALEIDSVIASPLVDGSGMVSCSHGWLPVPTPATLEILLGIPVRQIEEPHEFITPTGAALLAELCSSFGPLPEMRIERIGYGLGTRDAGNRPNVLRALLGELHEVAAGETDEITQIETNLDDLTPELAAGAMERLFSAGALDVFFTPAQMKKDRPGFLLTVLSPTDKSSELARLLLTETTAFGVRMHRAQRLKLRREFHERETPYGTVRIKLGFLGDELVQSVPEYSSCLEVARGAGVSVKDVYVAAWIGTPPRPVSAPDSGG
jgi:pyridinium-3,5-bisthiocarboxylic acid mononucleotide nickel chelatase